MRLLGVPHAGIHYHRIVSYDWLSAQASEHSLQQQQWCLRLQSCVTEHLVLSCTLSMQLRQPAVVAEMLAGIVLGPTAMGRIPRFTATIFPAASLGVISTIANFALIFFMFLVGLEVRFGSLSGSIVRLRPHRLLCLCMFIAQLPSSDGPEKTFGRSSYVYFH